MLLNIQVNKDTLTRVLQVEQNKNIAILQFSITNTSNSDCFVDIYLCQKNKTPATAPESLFIKNLTLKAEDTFSFNVEKFLLSDGESIWVKTSEICNVFVIYTNY